MELKQTGAGKYGFFGRKALAFSLLFVMLFMLYGDSYRPADLIIKDEQVIDSTWVFTQIDDQDENKSVYALPNIEVGEIFVRGEDRQIYDDEGNIILDEEIRQAYESGFVYETPNADFDLEAYKNAQENKGQKIRQLSLDDLIPRPDKPDPNKINLVTYPKYGVKAPLIYTEPKDFFYKKSDGTLDYTKPIDPSKMSAYDSTQIPIQIKLRDGVVHLSTEVYPTSVMPGEIGNAYIVGHSSNYNWVESNYNQVFRPIMQKSKPGEEFFIYDKFGRELRFKVFETKLISKDDVNEAFKLFDDRRVCTLQTSVLSWQNGRLVASHRWLTRGELVLD